VEPLTIGKAEAYFFNGRIDEVDIFNRALSADEIQAIFAAENVGKCRPVSGEVHGIIPDTGEVICQNLTTSQNVTITVPKNVRTWNCEAAGLTVNPGDKININASLTGSAQ
jgi:hypothetical protein